MVFLVFAIFGALFALIFLPLTAVVSDACLVLPELPKRLGEITGAPTIQNISDTVRFDYQRLPTLYCKLKSAKGFVVDFTKYLTASISHLFNRCSAGTKLEISLMALALMKS